MSETLRECPFCGGVAYTVYQKHLYWMVECHDCATLTGLYAKKDFAIEAWNTRVERTCVDVSIDKTIQFYCSKCECTVDVPLLWGAVNYCPNCGAKVKR